MQNVLLKKFDFQRDLKNIFEFMMDDKQQLLFSHKFSANNIIEFENWMIHKFKYYYHEFFTLENSLQDQIGFAYSHDFFATDGHTKVTLCIYPKYQNTGIGAIATLKFIDYLFSYYPLRKIYVTAFAYNEQSLKSNLQAGFVEESRLKEYRYYQGQYYDLHVLAMSYERFYELYSSILKRINGESYEKL